MKHKCNASILFTSQMVWHKRFISVFDWRCFMQQDLCTRCSSKLIGYFCALLLMTRRQSLRCKQRQCVQIQKTISKENFSFCGIYAPTTALSYIYNNYATWIFQNKFNDEI